LLHAFRLLLLQWLVFGRTAQVPGWEQFHQVWLLLLLLRGLTAYNQQQLFSRIHEAAANRQLLLLGGTG
jgi:hypothetical protein